MKTLDNYRSIHDSGVQRIQNELMFLIKILVFWMLFFLVERLLFITYNLYSQGAVSLRDYFLVLIHGLRLDLSTACYLTLIPFLYWCFRVLFLKEKDRLLKLYFYVTIPVFSFILVVNLELYRQWGEKIGATAISYLQYPTEAWASMSSSPLLILILIFFLFCGFSLYGAIHLVSGISGVPRGERRISPKVLLKRGWKIPIVFLLLFVGIRGGTQLAPINQSFAYFSSRPFLNDAAVNTLWNLVFSLTKNQKSNPYLFSDQEWASEQLDSLYSVGAEKPGMPVLSVRRPNIILIILEGWAADVVSAFGQTTGLTANMDTIIEKGLLFSNIYANGNRTDRGLVALLSGFPSQPRTSIIKQPQKTQTLLSLPRVLREAGYQTCFYYGGETEFANIKSYLLNIGYDKIVDQSSFRPEDMNSKWGAHDHVVFNRVLSDIKQMQSPYFITVLTLSSHEPFEVPMERVIAGNDQVSLYKNSIVYADRSVGAFVRALARYPEFENTLLIFISDHGFHLERGPLSQWLPARYHIPMVFYGPVLSPDWHGKRVNKIGSQTDLPVTLLEQIHLNSQLFRYGKDLLNPAARSFAFYTFNEGFGWMTPELKLLYDHHNKDTVVLESSLSKPDVREAETLGKAYLQALFQDYLDR
jgi:phosphoglycerol transferase MdoB-like AlkP superfamily enzyme